MAIGAVRGHAEFVRRETTHSSDATARGRSTGLRAPPRASTSTLGQLRGAAGNFRDPTKPSQTRAAHACPGAIEGCAASPQGPGHVPSGCQATLVSLHSPRPSLTRRHLARGAGPFPTRKGCPRSRGCTTWPPIAPGLQSKRCRAPEAAKAVAPQGSRREARQP